MLTIIKPQQIHVMTITCPQYILSHYNNVMLSCSGLHINYNCLSMRLHNDK